jgi:urease accessory protein
MILVRAAPVLLLMLVANPAAAHSPIEGIGSFYAGLLHPFAVPAHAMALTALALLLGQGDLATARLGLSVAVAALCLGLAVGPRLTETLPFPALLLVAALVLGTTVALAPPLPRPLSATAAGLVSLGVGLDSAPSAADLGEVLAALGGTAAGATLLIVVLTGVTTGRDRAWQRIGIRIAGSWIAAIALLVLALALQPPERQLSLSMISGPARC